MPNPDGTPPRLVTSWNGRVVVAGHFWSEPQPPVPLDDMRRIAALYQRLVGPIADEPVVVEARPAAGTPGSRPSGEAKPE